MSPKTKQRLGTSLGVLFILIGVPGLVLPLLQGWLFIAIGVALLSTFSPRFGRFTEKIKNKNPFAALHLDRGEARIERFFRWGTHRQKRFLVQTEGRTVRVMADIVRKDQKGVAVIVHGLGGYKEQPLIRALAESFMESHYTVVRYDATNSVGESSGDYSRGTTTSFIQDLSMVIEWIKTMPFYNDEPLWLSGHSLGGLSVLEYAAQHQSRVAGVITVGAVISGLHSKATILEYRPSEWEEWSSKGYREDKVPVHAPKNRLPFSHMEDRMSYNLIEKAQTITAPILMVVGEKDENTPLSHQRELYVRLPGEKRLVILKDAPHTPRSHADLLVVKAEAQAWIKNPTNPPQS